MPEVSKNGTNVDVKFFSKGGRQTQNIQIYKDIDQLNKDNGYGQDGGR